jgi:hypothetical protein
VERGLILQVAEKRAWQRTAWLAACIMSAISGKRVKPKRLLPWAFKEDESEPMTKEQARKELEEIKRSVGIE